MKPYPCLKILLFLLFPLFLSAQQIENDIRYIDKVYLKNGSQLIGKILKYDLLDPKGTLVMQTMQWKELAIPNDIVVKVIQKPLRGRITYVDTNYQHKERYRKAYQFQERGWYKALYLHAAGGTGAGTELGVGASAVIGYQWKRQLGVGVGFDVQHYDIENLMNTFNAPFVEVRSFLRARNVSPYYRVGLGYGFLHQNDLLPQYESQGGLFFYPAIGLRLGGSNNINASFDIGMRFQKVHTTYKFDWEWGEINYLYRRTAIRFGILF